MTLGAEIRAAYDAAGEAWASGPATLYDELAVPLVDAAVDVRGSLALDVGTGAGSVAHQLRIRGATVLACDGSLGMLAVGRAGGVFVGDLAALPVRTAAADVVCAGFVLNHLPDPVAGLRELARVVRPGGQVLASTFAGDAAPGVKEQIDTVARRHGYTAPPWYEEVKRSCHPLLETPAAFREVGAAAGLAAVSAEVTVVRPLLSAEQVVGWRLGMAHYAGFVAALDAEQRAVLQAEAVEALGEPYPVLELPVVVLRGLGR